MLLTAFYMLCIFIGITVLIHVVSFALFVAPLRKQLQCTIVVSQKFLTCLSLLGGVKGIAWSYIRGYWDCDNIEQLTCFIHERELHWWGQRFILTLIGNSFRRLKNRYRFLRDPDKQLVKKQYNTGNDFFMPVLGPTRAYTCAHWDQGITTLDQAQEAKFLYIDDCLGLSKLQPDKPFTLCDIGCGNAPYLQHVVTRFPWIKAVGITTSVEMAKSGREFCQGLPVEIRVMNYKDFLGSSEQFDAVVSVGMFEAVQARDYALYAQVIRHILKPGGLYFHHCIVRIWGYDMVGEGNDPNPYIDDEVFPGGILPAHNELLFDFPTAMGTWPVQGLCIVRNRCLPGWYYAETLRAWYENMEKHWEEISQNPAYDRRFFRKWKLWFLACAGSFRAERFRVAQIVYQRVPFE